MQNICSLSLSLIPNFILQDKNFNNKQNIFFSGKKNDQNVTSCWVKTKAKREPLSYCRSWPEIIFNKTQNKELFQPKKYNKFITITNIFSFKWKQILRDRWKRSIYTAKNGAEKANWKKKFEIGSKYAKVSSFAGYEPLPKCIQFLIFCQRYLPPRPQIKVKVHGRVHCHSAWYTFRTF